MPTENTTAKSDKPSLRIVVKYCLLQLPGQAAFLLIFVWLRQWLEVPSYVMWGLFGCWVGKDFLLFPLLWRHYDPEYHSDRFQMVGRRGLTLTRLDPGGYVRVRSERWRADAAEETASIEKGEEICVDGVDGLKLTVSACAKD